jgi:hypothetical protein
MPVGPDYNSIQIDAQASHQEQKNQKYLCIKTNLFRETIIIMKMDWKLSITLLVAMVSLLIIGVGGTAPAEAAGNCFRPASTGMTAAELVTCLSESGYQAANPELMVVQRSVVADDSTTAAPVSDSGYQAANPELVVAQRSVVAARYTGLAKFYTSESDELADDSTTAVPVSDRGHSVVAARYTGLAKFYTRESDELGAAQTEPAGTEFQQNLILHPNYFHPGR